MGLPLNPLVRIQTRLLQFLLSALTHFALMAGAFTSPSGITPLTRNSSFKTSITCPITLRPPLVLFSGRKSTLLSLSLLCKCNSTSIWTPKHGRDPVISEGKDEDLSRLVCPGCGVFMQDAEPNLPGYYKRPTPKDKHSFSDADADADDDLLANSDEFAVIEDELVNDLSEESHEDEDIDSFSDLEEFDLGSDWEDDQTLKKSEKDKSFKLDRKSQVEDELACASLEEFDSDKETNELSDLDQMGYAGLGQDTDIEEAEVSEFEIDKHIGQKSKRSKKLSSQIKSGFKSTGKTFSSLNQFLEEEESEEGPFSNSGIDEELDEFTDSDEEIDEFTDLDEEDTDWDKHWDELDEKEKRRREMDGFAPPGIGYGKITEEFLKKIKKEKISKSEKKRKLREEAKRAKQEAGMVTVCARCHSLRNYGQIKNPNVENLIPDFDFDRFISTRLMKSTGNASVVVMVVDCTDFDGSFPKVATKSLFKALEGTRSKPNKLPKLILVATKVDLLPSQISPARLDKWVRSRAKANGAHKLDAVYQVSSHKDLNIRNLISCIKKQAGPRGNVWVVGAQNAGKSTLINAFAKKQGVKITKLTEAAVPGTTLGILRVTGILPAKVKMFDTPGLLHPGLVMNRLNRDEQKMVEFRKELKPRSFRIKAGQTVHVGGLMRLDLIQASVQTIYVTVWASLSISLHMGKIDNADELHKNHLGSRLQPPIGQDRVSELGEFTKREFKVCGSSWDVNSMDIAVSGTGWFSLGLKGEATVALWTLSGVEVVQREPLIIDRAPHLERPGFWLPQAISDLIGQENKRKAQARKEVEELLLEASV